MAKKKKKKKKKTQKTMDTGSVSGCLRKKNSKTAYQLVNDLTTEKQDKSTTIQYNSGSVSQMRMKSLTGGQSTAQTFTSMRLMTTQ